MMEITITRIPAKELVRFECPECGETWFVVVDASGKPLGTMHVDDYHLGLMYRAAEHDNELVEVIEKATKSRR